MKRIPLAVIAIVTFISIQHPLAQGAAQAEKLLAAADHAATVDGNLKGAIEQYKKAFDAAGSIPQRHRSWNCGAVRQTPPTSFRRSTVARSSSVTS